MAWSLSWPRATGLPTACPPPPTRSLGGDHKGRMVWELGIQTDTDSQRQHCSSNVLWHLPTAPPLTPGPCQRGTRETPWVTAFRRLAGDTASAQKGGPQKELVSQGEAGTPAPTESADPVPRDPTLSPLLPATGPALGTGVHSDGARAKPGDQNWSLLEKEEGSAPRTHSSQHSPNPGCPHPSRGKTPVTLLPALTVINLEVSPFTPPQAEGWPVLGSGSALCSRVG